MQDFPKNLLGNKKEIQPQNERELFITFLPPNQKENILQRSYKNESEIISNKSNLRVEKDMFTPSNNSLERKEQEEENKNQTEIIGSSINKSKEFLSSQNNEDFELLDIESFNMDRKLIVEKFNIIGDTTDYLFDLPIRTNQKKKILKEIDYDLLYIKNKTYEVEALNKTFFKMQHQQKTYDNPNSTDQKEKIIKNEEATHNKRLLKPVIGIRLRNQLKVTNIEQKFKNKTESLSNEEMLLKKEPSFNQAFESNLLDEHKKKKKI